ncbi:hypothetical protein H4219_000577 [Mycoemilia scoparia]|uniref:DUF2428 domain-containing protein n=1 Tax=Mycoemilia scoparia TaxID=417184 RepID=A0A9W8A396_9FUNG|nr:hypothetical protein H4219_000577 [Mycoemilia scoparia]
MGRLTKNKALRKTQRYPVTIPTTWESVLEPFTRPFSNAKLEYNDSKLAPAIPLERFKVLELTNDKSWPKEPQSVNEYMFLAIKQFSKLSRTGTATWDQQSKCVKDIETTTDLPEYVEIFQQGSLQQQSQMFHSLFSNEVGSYALSKHAADIMVFIIEKLQLVVEKLNKIGHKSKHVSDRGNSEKPGTMAILAYQDDCMQAIRCLFRYFHEPGKLGQILERSVANVHQDQKSIFFKTIRLFYVLLWDILNNSSLPLEPRQIAAMCIIAFLDDTSQPPLHRAKKICSKLLGKDFIDGLSGSKSTDDQTSGAASKLPNEWVLSEEEDKNYSLDLSDSIALLCLSRATVCHAKTETLLCVLQSEKCGNMEPRLLHELIFTNIASVCGRLQLSPSVKVLAFDSMALWQRFTTRLLLSAIFFNSKDNKHSKDTQIDVALYTSEELIELQSAEDVDLILELCHRIMAFQSERILGYLVGFWEDPMDAVQSQTKAVFESLLSLGSLINHTNMAKDGTTFNEKVLEHVLSLDWGRKIKYSLLAVLCSRLGANVLVKNQRDIIERCLGNMSEVMLAPRIALFLEAYIAHQKKEIEEIKDTQDMKDSEAEYVERWAVALSSAMLTGNGPQFRMLERHIIPLVLRVFPSIMHLLIETFTANVTEASDYLLHQHALITILYSIRRLNIMTLDMIFESTEKSYGIDLMSILKQAVNIPSWEARANLLGLLCESKKLTIPISPLEAELLEAILVASTNPPSADYRQRQYSALIRLSTRMVASSSQLSKIIDSRKPQKERDEAKETVDRTHQIIKRWLDLAIKCLHPSAGFATVANGLSWLDIIVQHFDPSRPLLTIHVAIPFDVGLSDQELIQSLLYVLLDHKYEANCCSAFDLLMRWPISPPGSDKSDTSKHFTDTMLISNLIDRGLQKVNSARADDSSSGSMVLQWIFKRFVLSEGIHITFPNRYSILSPSESENQNPVLKFVMGILALVERSLEKAKINLLDASRNYPIHGLLSILCNIIEEIDFTSKAIQNCTEEWKSLLDRMLSVTEEASNLVMEVLTNPSPEGNVPSSFREMETKIDEILKGKDEFGDNSEDPELDDINDIGDDVDISGLEGAIGPKHQIILSYCWRVVKEYAALLCIATTHPPSDDYQELPGSGKIMSSGKGSKGVSPIVRSEKIVWAGKRLQTLLTSIRHRGAFMAVFPWFTRVCERLWSSPKSELNSCLVDWLAQCLDTIHIGDVSVTRRSAGWPLFLLGIISCSKGATNKFLCGVMNNLFVIIKTPVATSHSQSQKKDTEKPVPDGTTDLPQVHAINMLRVLVDDKTIASDVLPFIEKIFVLTIEGLCSPLWAIRNASGLLFASLLRRIFGNKKTRDETSQINGITGRELFTRFPGLHPYLMNQLEDAVGMMYQEVDDDSSLVNLMHPALYPCLVLLSRLQPSILDDYTEENSTRASRLLDNTDFEPKISSSVTESIALPTNLDLEVNTNVNERNTTIHTTTASTSLSMFNFVELVEACSVGPIYKTREMAARAFAPLINSSQMPGVAAYLLKDLEEPDASYNIKHGRLCQAYSLLYVHMQSNKNEDLRIQVILKVAPVISALWDAMLFECHNDIVRALYFKIVREFFCDDSWWRVNNGNVTPYLADLIRSTIHSFQRKMAKSLLVSGLSEKPSSSLHIPGSYLTMRELNSIILGLLGESKVPMLIVDSSSMLKKACCPAEALEIDIWGKIRSSLTNDVFYESKLDTISWLKENLDHIITFPTDIFSIGRLRSTLVFITFPESVDSSCRSKNPDPVLKSASIDLLTEINNKFTSDKIDGLNNYPVQSIHKHWGDVLSQIQNTRSLSVSRSLIRYSSSLVSFLCADISKFGKYEEVSISDEDVSILEKTGSNISKWVKVISSFTKPNAEASYREAACQAIKTITTVLKDTVFSKSNTGLSNQVDRDIASVHTQVMLSLLDLLQDDNQSVRETAEEIVYVQTDTHISSDRGAEVLIENAVNSLHTSNYNLISAFTERLLGEKTFDHINVTLTSKSSKLFLHEKENVYKDEWHELQLYAFGLICAIETARKHQAYTQDTVLGLVSTSEKCLEHIERLAKTLDSGMRINYQPDMFIATQCWLLFIAVYLCSLSHQAPTIDPDLNKRILDRTVVACKALLDKTKRTEFNGFNHPIVNRSLTAIISAAKALSSNKSDSFAEISSELVPTMFPHLSLSCHRLEKP